MQGQGLGENDKDNDKEIDMRHLHNIYLVLLTIAMCSMVGCEKPTPLPSNETIAVTYSSLDGSWELSNLQGVPIAEDTYLYISFDRREHRYTMWDNLNSMYATDTTGTFTITEEEDGTYTLSGTYDYGVGDWNNEYSVTLSEGGNRMLWRAKTGTHEVMEFRHIDEIPEIY